MTYTRSPILGLRVKEFEHRTLTRLFKVCGRPCRDCRTLLNLTLWQKCWVVMLKTSRHSEAFFNWACRVCSCRACRSHRSRSCWIWARSTSCAFSVWMAPWTAVVRPRTADMQNSQKNIAHLCIFLQTYNRNRNIERNRTNKSISLCGCWCNFNNWNNLQCLFKIRTGYKLEYKTRLSYQNNQITRN